MPDQSASSPMWFQIFRSSLGPRPSFCGLDLSAHSRLSVRLKMQELPEQLSGKRHRAEQEPREQEDSRLPASAVGAEVSDFSVRRFMSSSSGLEDRS
eukprot:4681296-Amphidinium_carterae.1